MSEKIKKVLTSEEKIAKETAKLLKQKQILRENIRNELSSLLRCDSSFNNYRFIVLDIYNGEVKNVVSTQALLKEHFENFNTKIYYLFNNKFKIVRSFEEAKKLNVDTIKRFIYQNDLNKILIIHNEDHMTSVIIKSLHDLSGNGIKSKYKFNEERFYVVKNKKLQIVKNNFICKMSRDKYEKFIIALDKSISQLSVNEIDLLKEYKKWPFESKEKGFSDCNSFFRMMPPCMGCR